MGHDVADVDYDDGSWRTHHSKGPRVPIQDVVVLSDEEKRDIRTLFKGMKNQAVKDAKTVPLNVSDRKEYLISLLLKL